MEFHVQTASKAGIYFCACRQQNWKHIYGAYEWLTSEKYHFYLDSGILGFFDNQIPIATGAGIIL